jgi:hypothetical protein
MKKTYIKKNRHLHFKPKLWPLIMLILLCFGTNNTNAQESLNTSAGIASNTNGFVSYTIGQVFYNSQGDSNGSLSEGIQYAIELQNLSNNNFQFELNVTIFPNPSTSIVNIKTKTVNDTKLHYELYDLLGRLIKSNSITSEKTIINVEDLDIATYQLNIMSSNQKLLKSFKIIKN